MSHTPSHWQLARLTEVADVRLGRQRSPKNHQGPDMRPYLRAANVTWEGLALHDVKEMNFSPPERDTYRLRRGDILLSEASGSADEVGKPAIWRDDLTECYFQNTLLRVRPRCVDPQYLLWFFRWLAFSRQFAKSSRGVGIHHLGAQALAAWVIPLPPLLEQERIVAAIDEELSRIQVGVRALSGANHGCTALAHSSVDLLTSEASSAVAQTYQPVGKLLAKPLANGRSVPDGTSGGFPVLRLSSVRDGRVDVTVAKRGAWNAEQAAPFIVRAGDFLVVRGNGSKNLVGRGGLVMTDAPVAFPDTLIRLRPSAQLRPRFLALIWDSHAVREQLEARARTTAGIYKISQPDIAAVRLPVPSLGEQDALIERTESSIAAARRAATVVHAAMEDADRLRSTVLAAAFQGALIHA